MFDPSDAPRLPGRQPVLDDLGDLVLAAVEGRGGSLTLVADPGVGKTAVLDVFVAVTRRTFPEATVITVRGVEAEHELAWAGLHALLEPLRAVRATLAPPRARALASALAEVDSGDDGAIDPFAVAIAAYDVMAAAADRAPLVVVVDDLHWIDLPTQRTLAFVARRIAFDRIAIVTARRPVAEAAGDPEAIQVLTPLDDRSADEVLGGLGVADATARHRLVDAAAGNPLVLHALVARLDADQRAGRAPLPDPLPVASTADRVVDVVVDALAPDVRRALLVAAAEAEGDLTIIVPALRHLGLDPGSLAIAEGSGVVTLTADRLAFRHPLLRSAVYHDAADADRRAAHGALAETVVAASAARAWHRALATFGPDDAVAAALDDAAVVAARRGAPSVAGRLLERASRLSEGALGRARRLRQAAAAYVAAAQPAAAEALLARAAAADLAAAEVDPAAVEVEALEQLRVRTRLPDGGGEDGLARLLDGARRMADDHPELAADLVADAAARAVEQAAWESLVEMAAIATAVRDRLDDERHDRMAVIAGLVGVALDDPSAGALLDRWRHLATPERVPAQAAFLAGVVVPALAFLRRLDEADALLDQLEPGLRARGAHADLAIALGARAMSQYGRSLPATLQATAEALALADAVGAPIGPLYTAATQALAAAVVGDRERCEEAVAQLRRQPDRRREASALIALGLLALVERRLDEADALYRRLEAVTPVGSGIVRWEGDWIETLVRAGRRDEACALLARVEQVVVGDGWNVRNGLDRVRAMLADDDDEAGRLFASSCWSAERSDNAIGLGRTETAWGERLRRARRRGEARPHLERARSLLRAVGAAGLAQLAERELVAAGGTADASAPLHERLTAHELGVARLTVAGASNRHLADQLFISPRTVEAHLSSIFRKLGVANRRELAALALEHPFLRP